ncbi:MAG: metal-dependent transcriptional regulator [candidate division Zixibacteria bacterium]|nr:metal-dependent transcriptional regulator [candidate division Zixibacteria bacterium]
MEDQLMDEFLETVWLLKEENNNSYDALLKSQPKKTQVVKALDEAIAQKLVEKDGNKIEFTPNGENQAKEIIRRHRLAERLFSEVFGLKEDDYESTACSFEHILEPEVTESICTFLGHPPTCPHGKPIPKGPCCLKNHKEMKPLVVPLTELGLGEKGGIVFITPKYHSRLDRLNVLGVCPGQVLRLHQKSPSFVIKVDETEIAIDKEIAKEIYVKRL